MTPLRVRWFRTLAAFALVLAVALNPPRAIAPSFPVTQEWVVLGASSGPAATQVADGSAEGMQEADTLPDSVTFPLNQTITSGTLISGSFPASIDTSDNSYLQWQETGTPSSLTTSSNPTGLGGLCNFAAGGSGMTSNNVYASSSSNTHLCIYGGFGFTLGSVTITGVEIGYEAYTLSDDRYDIALSPDGGTSFPCASGPLALPTSDPNTYSYLDFTACRAWTPAEINNLAARFTHSRIGGANTNFLDANVVRVTYTVITDFVLGIQYDWTGVPALGTHILVVEARVGSENLVVDVLTPPATWNPRLTFVSVGDQTLTYSFVAAEYNGGNPIIRVRDTSADGTASDYWVDLIEISTVAFAHSLDVRHNLTGITGINPVLQLRGNITAGGENFNLYAWNSTSGLWDFVLASPFTSTNAYHNATLGQAHLSGGVVRLRYLDTDPASVARGYLSLDLVQVSTVPGNAPPGLSNGGVSPSVGNTSTLFTFFVRYTDVDDDRPYALYVNVNGTLYPMLENNSGDTTYTDGKDYYRTMMLSRGTHNFGFQGNASTGNLAVVSIGGSTVQVVNRPPVITNAAPLLSVHTGTFLRRTFTASDPDGDTPTWSLSTNASWLSIGPANGSLSGRAPLLPSSFRAYVNVSDGWGGNDSNSFTLLVGNSNPTITSTPATSWGAGLVYTQRPQGSDPDGDTLTWGMRTNATWLSINPATGELLGTAAPGTYYVQLLLRDPFGGSSELNYTLTVQASISPPTPGPNLLWLGLGLGVAGAALGYPILWYFRRKPKGEIILKAIMFSDRGIVLEELVSDSTPEPPIKFRDIVQALGEDNLKGTHELSIGDYHIVVIQDNAVHLAAVSHVRNSKLVMKEARDLLDNLLAKESAGDSTVYA